MTSKPTSDSWIICPKRNPQVRLRLFCFPCAGGTTSVFNKWVNNLPSDIEICSVQLPGRGYRLMEQSFTQISELLPKLVPVLLPYLNVPFAFLGHSMGAVLSFEVARELRRQGHPSPVHLFVCGCPAPQALKSNPPIHLLPEAALVAELHNRYNAIPETILQNNELMQLFLPSLRADFAMLETYLYTTDQLLDCQISAFGGLQDNTVSYDSLTAWRDQTRSSFTLQLFPGNHFFLHDPKSGFLQALSQQLYQFLSQLLYC